jgi:hypothetical protein
MTELQNLPPGSVDILTLSAPQLSSLQSRLSQELEHLTTSYTRLRSAQARFRDCIASIKTGVDKQADRTSTPLYRLLQRFPLPSVLPAFVPPPRPTTLTALSLYRHRDPRSPNAIPVRARPARRHQHRHRRRRHGLLR